MFRVVDISDKLRDYINQHLAQEVPIELKPIDPMVYMGRAGLGQEARQRVWVRAKGHIGKGASLFGKGDLTRVRGHLTWILGISHG